MIVRYSPAISGEGYVQLARSFEELLVLAANIQDVILGGDLENPVAEFAERLVKLGVPEGFVRLGFRWQTLP